MVLPYLNLDWSNGDLQVIYTKSDQGSVETIYTNMIENVSSLFGITRMVRRTT